MATSIGSRVARRAGTKSRSAPKRSGKRPKPQEHSPEERLKRRVAQAQRALEAGRSVAVNEARIRRRAQ